MPSPPSATTTAAGSIYDTSNAVERASRAGCPSRPPAGTPVPGGHERSSMDGAERAMSTFDLEEIKFDRDGLVPAIVQEQSTGDVLMMAWMNETTLRRTLEEGRTVFWSRSRQEEWRKGDTSGD